MQDNQFYYSINASKHVLKILGNTLIWGPLVHAFVFFMMEVDEKDFLRLHGIIFSLYIFSVLTVFLYYLYNKKSGLNFTFKISNTIVSQEMPVNYGGKSFEMRIADIEKIICFWSVNEELYHYTITNAYNEKFKITRQYKNPCDEIVAKLVELNENIYFVDKKDQVIEDVTIRPFYSVINDSFRGYFFPVLKEDDKPKEKKKDKPNK